MRDGAGRKKTTVGQATSPIRVAAVEYLNTRPLVYGLDSWPDLFKLEFEVPSRCARLLHDGSVDLAMRWHPMGR